MKYAFKLFSLRKNGTIGSLFINKKTIIPINKWIKAENHPTRGFKKRFGWHCAPKKFAPHLSIKGRVWKRVVIKNFDKIPRPEYQGGHWYIAKWMKVCK